MRRYSILRGMGILLWHVRVRLMYAAAYVWRRLLLRTTFIAVTGSVGKTTAKECLAAALASRYRTAKSHDNQNDFSGVSRSLLRVRPWHRFAVLELAGNGFGLMKRSARLTRPDIAIILSVARTHLRDFRTLENVALEKVRLLAALRANGVAVLNGDDPRVAAMAAPLKQRVVWFGSSPAFEYRAISVSSQWPERLSFDVQAGGERGKVQTQFVGVHWRSSVLGAVAAAHVLGMTLRDVIAAVSLVKPTPGRMQPQTTPSGATVIRDELNGSVDTLKCALDAMAEASAARRILVMTDVTDTSQSPRDRLRKIGREAAGIFDAAVFIGGAAGHGVRGAIQGGMNPENTHEFVSAELAAEFLKKELKAGDLVLLRGRATDHLSRLFHVLRGTIKCRKAVCEKTILCDSCPELGALAPPEDS